VAEGEKGVVREKGKTTPKGGEENIAWGKGHAKPEGKKCGGTNGELEEGWGGGIQKKGRKNSLGGKKSQVQGKIPE